MTEYLPHLFTILYLVLIEGLLSFDNALALAALVNKTLSDPAQRKKALTYGIWGAYIFRTAAIFLGVWLMAHDWVKLVAGGYLIYLAIKELAFSKGESSEDGSGSPFVWLRLSPLWSTIVAVELMDIMFSVDSVGVALAVSDVPWVLITGAFLGILTMRVAAGMFMGLIQKFPLLEKTAFVLVGIAGINVCLKVFHYELPEAIFLAIMGGIFIASLLFSKLSRKEESHV